MNQPLGEKEKNFIVTVKQGTSVKEVADQCRSAGMKIKDSDVLDMGFITGKVDPMKQGSIAAIPGVVSVEEEGERHTL